MPLDEKIRQNAAKTGAAGTRDQTWTAVPDRASQYEEPDPDRQFRSEEPIPDRASWYEEPDPSAPDVIPISPVSEAYGAGLRKVSDALDEITRQLSALQEKSGTEDISRRMDSLREKIDGLDAGRQMSALMEKIGALEVTAAEIREKQARNDRQLAQYIKENVNFQIQVRQGMQEELEEFRKEKKGDQYNAILRELADIFSVYKPLLLDGSDPDKLPKNIGALFDQLKDLMYDYGAETFQSSPGTERTPRMSKVIRKVPTGDRTKHNLIARSSRPGVRKGKLLLSEEYVDLYVYDEALDVPQPEPAPGEASEQQMKDEASEDGNSDEASDGTWPGKDPEAGASGWTPEDPEAEASGPGQEDPETGTAGESKDENPGAAEGEDKNGASE